MFRCIFATWSVLLVFTTALDVDMTPLLDALSEGATVLPAPFDDQCNAPGAVPSSFVNATWTYNPAYVSKPSAVIRLFTTEDVQETVKFLTQRKLSFRLRASGHNLAGYSGAPCSQFLLDLSGMDKIERTSDGLTTIGPGVRGDSLFHFLLPYREVVVSCAPSVHVLGMLLVGGISELSTVQGLNTDLAREFQVVLFDGSVVTASAQENTDLFFALRGAGAGSFGVVTKATIQALPVPTEMGKGKYTIQDASKDGEGLKQLIKTYRDEVVLSAASGIPLEMGVYLTLVVVPGARLFFVDWTYFGESMEPARAALDDWMEAAAESAGVSVASHAVDSTTYEDYVANYQAKVGPTDAPEAWLSPFQLNFSDEYVDAVFDACDKAIADGANKAILLLLAEEANGQPAGMATQGNTDTSSFAHREARFWWLDFSSCPFGQLHICETFVRTILHESIMDGNAASFLGLYSGIQSRTLESYGAQSGFDLQTAFYGQKGSRALLEKLLSVKETYDPENVFCTPQSLLPCSAPSADNCHARGPSPATGDDEEGGEVSNEHAPAGGRCGGDVACGVGYVCKCLGGGGRRLLFGGAGPRECFCVEG